MNPPCVVLIDDEPISLTFQEELLKPLRLTVESYADPLGALKRLRAGGVALVITDVRMPGMDGLELMYEISNLPHPPKVIVFTAHAQPLRHLSAKADGHLTAQTLQHVLKTAFGVLCKPPEIEQYKRMVTQALGLAPLI